VIIEDPTIPQMLRYTTLRNVRNWGFDMVLVVLAVFYVAHAQKWQFIRFI